MLSQTTMKLVFAVSTGRCGSTLLSRMLEDAAPVVSVSEFFTLVGPETAFPSPSLSGKEFWALLHQRTAEIVALLNAARVPEVGEQDALAIRTEAASPLATVALGRVTDDPTRLHEELRKVLSARGVRPVAEHYRHLFEYIGTRSRGKRLLVERSGGSLAYVGALAAAFADASFVHLWRNGPDSALSMSQHPYFRVLVARLIARDPSFPVRACLEMEIPLDRFGAFWSATVVRGTAVLHRLPPRQVLHISFSDLTERPVETLTRLASFAGLEALTDWPSRAAVRVRRAEPRLSMVADGPRAALERSCIPGMRALERLKGHPRARGAP